jgi:peptidoglycan/xylan/chitin deacetylase (PgdA/CDA1 family)
MRRATLVGAAALAVHVIPIVTCILPLRRRLFPALSGVGSEGHLALTFDDGPDPKSTPAFLQALDDFGWKATFFMIGPMVRANPGLAAEVAAAGHEVAVHGDRHRSHLYRSLPDVSDDIRRCQDTIVQATGQSPLWLRPPYGELATSTLIVGRKQGLRTVLWTAWGRDWRDTTTPASVVDDVADTLTPGATVLLHDSDCTSAPESWRATHAALPALAELFAAHGLKPGRLADHGVD